MDLAYLPVSGLAGPHARAYAPDKMGETNSARFLLHMLLGDKVQVNPFNTLLDPSYEMQDRLWMLSETIWVSSYKHHCPAELAEAFLNREYPHRVSEKAETSLLRSLSNGFIFEAEEAKEMTFETFCEKYSQYTLSDKLIMNVHTRYSMMREVKYQCNGVKLACCISPITTGVKYIMAK